MISPTSLKSVDLFFCNRPFQRFPKAAPFTVFLWPENLVKEGFRIPNAFLAEPMQRFFVRGSTNQPWRLEHLIKLMETIGNSLEVNTVSWTSYARPVYFVSRRELFRVVIN
jgi:hypothetical protein